MSLGHSIGARPQFASPQQANVVRPDWRRLDPDSRLRLVASALRPSDGLVDLFPLAL